MSKACMCGIHLDLKGMQFKRDYVPQLLADLAAAGINTLLVEYEDIFPFEGIDVAWDKDAVWSGDFLNRFLAEAGRLELDVIPLQQCLGHLEYIFRWPRYRQFAEFQPYPGTLCLSKPEGKALIFKMLEQVMAAHPDSEYIHLGMDEAHRLASCPDCAARGDTVALFCEHLEELCGLADRYGKTPIIWPDMWEDHFAPEAFTPFRDRVVLAPWDYGTGAEELSPSGRFHGWRVSREWLDEPGNPAAPAIHVGTKFIEDLPQELLEVLKPYLKGRYFKSFFNVDLWTKLGFRLIGAGAVRASADYHVLPRYNHLRDNLRGWQQAIARTDQLGVIATSWARGTTFCPPNVPFDLTWPSIVEFAQIMDDEPVEFWPGIPPEELDLLIKRLGRCRADWAVETRLLEDMVKLEKQVTAHQFEFQSLILMTRLQALDRKIDGTVNEVDYFHGNDRLVPEEWQRRLADQQQLLAEQAKLSEEIDAHFSQRYEGDAYQEWLRTIFDLRHDRLLAAQTESRQKLTRSQDLFSP